jgi:hypothetical protein
MHPGLPRKGESRLTTRLGRYLERIAFSAMGKAIQLDMRAIASALGVKSETLVKASMRLRKSSWFFARCHCVLFLRYVVVATSAGPRPAPRFFVATRHANIGGKRRWHLRRRSEADWQGYCHRHFSIAISALIIGREARDRTNKGCSPHQAENLGKYRGAARWFRSLAGPLSRRWSARHPEFRVNVTSWASDRLAEGHTPSRIEAVMDRVARLIVDHRSLAPLSSAQGWLCGVARRHLDHDMLHPRVRWAIRGRQRGGSRLTPAASNEGRQAEAARQQKILDEILARRPDLRSKYGHLATHHAHLSS